MMKISLIALLICILSWGIVSAQDVEPMCTELTFDNHIIDGQIAYNNRNFGQAWFHFGCATQINPNSALAYRLLGDAYFDANQRHNAVEAYQQYRDLAGNETESYILERIEPYEVGLEEIGLIIVGVSSFLLATCAPVLFAVGIIFAVFRRRTQNIEDKPKDKV